jgi:hypothetical protein
VLISIEKVKLCRYNKLIYAKFFAFLTIYKTFESAHESTFWQLFSKLFKYSTGAIISLV